LDLARQRLSECNAGEPVGESLRLLAFERDPNDAILAEKHLRAASDLNAWQSGLYTLNEISPVRAGELLEETLSETSDPVGKASLMQAAALTGLHIDVRAAFECAVAELSSDNSDGLASYRLYMLIADVVSKSALPLDLVAVIERELPYSDGERRARLWQIAYGCKSSLIAEYAASCIDHWDTDLGYACNYFIEQLELARARQQRLLKDCERGLENEQTWYSWGISGALSLVGELGFSAKTAESLSVMVQRLVRLNHAIEVDDIASLPPGDIEVLKPTKLEHARFYLQQLVAPLIPAVAKARTFLSDEVLLSLLSFDIMHSSGTVQYLREALSGLDDAAIDRVVSGIKDPWARLSGLVTACARGSTAIRVNLLACELRLNYAHPAALHLMREAIEACWCKAIFEIIVKTVAEIPTWSEHDSQFFGDFARAVTIRLGPDDQAAIEAEIPIARTAVARRILVFWRVHASGERVGLARLSS
jgi:hypothetical protein